MINNKARYNQIDAKYQQMAFRSVTANPYLESLVKQNWCKFRELCLHSRIICYSSQFSKRKWIVQQIGQQPGPIVTAIILAADQSVSWLTEKNEIWHCTQCTVHVSTSSCWSHISIQISGFPRMASSLEFLPSWIVSALTIQFIKHFLDLLSYKKDELRSEVKKNVVHYITVSGFI